MKIEKLQLVKKDTSYNILIPQSVEHKIRYICKRIWDVEWSGILFYTYNGGFENNLEIRCVDILPMDIGTKTYTEFDMNPDVVSYIANNDLLDCQIGLIHSHNSFSTFFSGTDLKTLNEEGEDRNHFVSLIVNNKGEYSAAITRKVTVAKTVNDEVSYKTFDDADKKFNRTYDVLESNLEYYNLNIVFDENQDDTILDSTIDNLKNKNKEESQKPSMFDLYNDGLDDNIGYSQQSLFSKKDYDDIDFGKGLSYDNPDYSNVKVNSESVNLLVKQLVTGIIILSSNTEFDIDKWYNNMEKTFDNRFNAANGGFDAFKMWADSYIEFLCWNSDVDIDKYSKNVYDEDEKANIIAFKMNEQLKKIYPKNKYINKFIDILNKY